MSLVISAVMLDIVKSSSENAKKTKAHEKAEKAKIAENAKKTKAHEKTEKAKTEKNDKKEVEYQDGNSGCGCNFVY